MSVDNSPDGIRFVYKHYIVAFVLILCGIIIIYLLHSSHDPTSSQKKSVIHLIAEHLSMALVIAGMWHAINELIIKRHMLNFISNSFSGFNEKFDQMKIDFGKNKDEIINSISNARKDSKLGLIDTYHDVASFSFSDFISHPEELTIVLGDGMTWISNHIEPLRERLSNPTKRTKIFLMSPDSPALISVAKKMGKAVPATQERVNISIKMIESEITNSSRIKIILHDSVPHHSIFLGDRLLLSTYFFHKKKRNPPLFVFEKGSFVSKVQADLNELEGDSVVHLSKGFD